jgi:hypothetical protein
VARKSLQEIAENSVSAIDIEVRKKLCKNITLSGGITVYKCLPDRLKTEILDFAPTDADIGVIASADHKYTVWKGDWLPCPALPLLGHRRGLPRARRRWHPKPMLLSL